VRKEAPGSWVLGLALVWLWSAGMSLPPFGQLDGKLPAAPFAPPVPESRSPPFQRSITTLQFYHHFRILFLSEGRVESIKPLDLIEWI
jgi:hypothetical protein